LGPQQLNLNVLVLSDLETRSSVLVFPKLVHLLLLVVLLVLKNGVEGGWVQRVELFEHGGDEVHPLFAELHALDVALEAF